MPDFDFSRLTDRQLAVFRFILRRQCECGTAPSLREMMAEFGIRSPNGIVCHVEALRRKGFVALRQPGSPRSRGYGVRGVLWVPVLKEDHDLALEIVRDECSPGTAALNAIVEPDDEPTITATPQPETVPQ